MKTPTVKIMRLAELAGPDFPKGGDFADFSTEFRDGQAAETIKAEVEASADSAEVVRVEPTITADEPVQKNTGVATPVLTCMADIEAREVSWLWPGRIPLGRISMVVGRPGEGKSFLTCDMAARISNGNKWPDGMFCPQGSVILISAEDDPGDTIRPRLDAHGADVSRIHILSGVAWTNEAGENREVMFTLENLAALEECLQRLPDCKLMVIDPIGSYLGGKTDAHRDNEVRGVLAPVAKLAEQYGVAVLIVAHRRKSAGHNADETALGSRGFTGIARAVWHLSRDPENPERRLLLPGKNNLAREGAGLAFTITGQPAALAWEDGPVELSADQGLAAENAHAGDEKPGPEAEALDAAAKWLKELLTAGPLAATEVRKQSRECGISEATLRRAKHATGVDAHRPANPGPWFWRLPGSTCSTPENDPNTSEPEHLEHVPIPVAYSASAGEHILRLDCLDNLPQTRPQRNLDPSMRTHVEEVE